VALGSIVFAYGTRPWELAIGRALIGAAIIVTWFAAIKATATWFPRESLPVVNGWLVAVGSSGAIVAAGPADALAHWIGWRGLFVLLAAASIVAGVMTRLLVPAREIDAAPARGPSFAEVARELLTDRDFLRFAPLAGLAIGTAWAMQGLWAAVWLAQVDGYAHRAVVTVLVIMGCALSAAAPLLGVVAKRLRGRGVSTSTVLAGAVALFMLVQLLILAHAPLPAAALWGGSAIFGSLTGLAYALMAELYPRTKIARANSVLSLLVQGSGFSMQAGIGYVLDWWPKDAAGHHPLLAFEVAFAMPLALQAAALIWFLLGKRRPLPSRAQGEARLAGGDR
jgi:predicted MFS family arabinose efflux permease